MTEAVIRRYSAGDIPALTELWLENFDDTLEFVQSFYAMLPSLGHALVAELDGQIVGASHVLTGQELAGRDESCQRLGLVYGVSVAKNCRGRGIGEKLVRASLELSKEVGAEIFCCEPASASLVGWYDKVCGIKPALRREKRLVSAAKEGTAKALSAEEYHARREVLLAGRAHVRLSPAAMAFEEKMLLCYGGGFYMGCDCIAAVYMYHTRLMIRELICASEGGAESASHIAAALGAEDAEYCRNCPSGEAYILTDLPMPECSIWNLSFS